MVEKRRGQWFSDATLQCGDSEIRVNRSLLSMSSPYFRHLFSGDFREGSEVELVLGKEYGVVMDVVVNYLLLGVVAVPMDFSTQAWMEVAELAEYFCVEALKGVCEGQLCGRVAGETAEEL